MERAELEDLNRLAWELFNAHDMDGMVGRVADDFVNHNAAPGTPHGPEGQRQVNERLWSAFPDLSFETRRQYLRDDLVIQEWTASGTHKGTMRRSGIEVEPTGREVDYRGMDVIPIEDGLVARKDVYSDGVTLLRQLGLTDIS